MKWKKIDDYHMRFGTSPWTITYAKNATYPYGLNFDGESKGFFKTIDEAINKHSELSKHA